MGVTAIIIVVFVVLVVGLGVFILGWISANKVNHAKMNNAEAYAKKIAEDAERESENIKKAAILDAKDEWYKERTRFEKETRETRQEIEKLEQLRAIENGYQILTAKVEHTCDGIDTAEQYRAFVKRFLKK